MWFSQCVLVFWSGGVCKEGKCLNGKRKAELLMENKWRKRNTEERTDTNTPTEPNKSAYVTMLPQIR